MRVLLLGPYPPPHGGVQTNLVAIRQLLTERGIPSEVINLTRHRHPDRDGVYYPETPLEVLRLLFRLPASIIHIHIGGELPLRLLLLCLVCCLLPRRKTLLTFHSGGYPSSPAGQSASYWTLRGFVLRRFDCVIAINPQLQALFRTFGVPARKIRFILPYALPQAVPDLELPADVNRFFASHDHVLLSMGWLEPEYDYPLQIRALSHIRRSFPHAGLSIFGSGRLESELRALAAELNQSEHVLFAGDIPHALALVALSRCAIFLRTTLYDGDSISVREALHLGVPVIATDNGMRPEGVFLVPIGDENAVISAAAEFLTCPSPARRRYAPPASDPTHSVVDLYAELEAAI
jgi:glycogen(starch) synthase